MKNEQSLISPTQALTRMQQAISISQDVEIQLAIGGIYLIRSNHEIKYIKIVGANARQGTFQGKPSIGYYYEYITYEEGEWLKESPEQLHELSAQYYTFYAQLTQGQLEAQLKEAHRLLDTGNYARPEEEPINEGTLMSFSSKESYQALETDLARQKSNLSALKTSVEFLLAEKMNKMNRMKRAMQEQVNIWNKKISKLRKVIATIELYTGINEELVQIKEGLPADAHQPLHIRQMMVYLDEELADPEYQLKEGLTFKDMGSFLDWFGEDDNYQRTLPEPRCMVAARVRRHTRERGGWGDVGFSQAIQFAQEDALDMTTYLLIRNGENIYLVGSENIDFYGSTFPKKKMMNRLSIAADLLNEMNPQDSITTRELFDEKFIHPEFNGVVPAGCHSVEEAKEAIDERLFNYKMRFALFQGLLDRTPIFRFPERVALFDPIAQEKGYVRLIYDDEVSFPSHRQLFKHWHQATNQKIRPGSRIVVAWNSRDRYQARDSTDRFDARYGSKHRTPDLPGNGLYSVERLTSTSCYGWIKPINEEIRGQERQYEFLAIRYNPKDQIGWQEHSWEPRLRKNRVSFKIQHDDNFIINYDQLDLDTIEFYIQDRINRRDYLDMMPILYELKKVLIREEEREAEFIKMLQGEFVGMEPCVIKEQITWWKDKNEIKRPITKEEDKAYRMIKRKLQAEKRSS